MEEKKRFRATLQEAGNNPKGKDLLPVSDETNMADIWNALSESEKAVPKQMVLGYTSAEMTG